MGTFKKPSAISRKRTAVADKKPRPQSPLAGSPAKVEREIATFEKAREQLESAPTVAETNIRTTII